MLSFIVTLILLKNNRDAKLLDMNERNATRHIFLLVTGIILGGTIGRFLGDGTLGIMTGADDDNSEHRFSGALYT